MMFGAATFLGGLVIGYFTGVYRQKLLNVKSKVESALHEEFK